MLRNPVIKHRSVARFVVFVLAVLLCVPTLGRAQGDPVAKAGSAIYPGIDVNLEGGDGLHRLRLAFEAQCVDEKGAVLAASPEAREAVLLMLRDQTVAALSTPAGREKLKSTLVATLNRAIGSPRVVRVLYLQFVIR